jgi:UDP:flavonoid glycosyltransferase YjiC (YdhE family)
MKQRVVFLFYHGLGHVNALLKPAKILQASNYEVYFAGSGFFQDYISRQGFAFYLLKSYPFGIGLEKWINTIYKKRNSYYSTLLDRITDSVYNTREVDLYWMLGEIKPSFLFIDILQATDFIVLYSHLKNNGVATAMVNTMLPTQVAPARPPLNSEIIPSDSYSTAKAIRTMHLQKLKKKWKKKLIYLGFDDSLIIRRRLKKNNIPERYVSHLPNLLNFNVDNIPEIIFAPREFEFPGLPENPNQRYLGFMTDENRIESLETRYEEFAKRIFVSEGKRRDRVVFCSFGTVPVKEQRVLTVLLEKLILVAAEEKFILIVSNAAHRNTLANLPANVYMFKSVPQLQVLMHADVFITHGGLNSIKEAIHAEVPMLVYPLHSEYDPKGNAARVVYHGLGLTGDAKTESTGNLHRKIGQLLSDGCYKKNLLELKAKDACYTQEKFIDTLRGFRPPG